MNSGKNIYLIFLMSFMPIWLLRAYGWGPDSIGYYETFLDSESKFLECLGMFMPPYYFDKFEIGFYAINFLSLYIFDSYFMYILLLGTIYTLLLAKLYKLFLDYIKLDLFTFISTFILIIGPLGILWFTRQSLASIIFILSLILYLSGNRIKGIIFFLFLCAIHIKSGLILLALIPLILVSNTYLIIILPIIIASSYILQLPDSMLYISSLLPENMGSVIAAYEINYRSEINGPSFLSIIAMILYIILLKYEDTQYNVSLNLVSKVLYFIILFSAISIAGSVLARMQVVFLTILPFTFAYFTYKFKFAMTRLIFISLGLIYCINFTTAPQNFRFHENQLKNYTRGAGESL